MPVSWEVGIFFAVPFVNNPIGTTAGSLQPTNKLALS